MAQAVNVVLVSIKGQINGLLLNIINNFVFLVKIY